MKKNMMKPCLILISLLLLSASCSTIVRHDDAVRIKPKASTNYTTNPYTGATRNGSTLRGTVVKVEVVATPDSCPKTASTKYRYNTQIIFLDTANKIDEDIELIPVDDIELIGRTNALPLNTYNNINLFENFNDPKGLKSIREVPVDTVLADSCPKCDCRPFNAPSLPDWQLDLTCPKRNYSWFFVELRAGYGIYNDYLSPGISQGRESWLGEIAAGFRFGADKQWGVGLAYTTGVPAMNSFMGTDVRRPAVLLHARYQLLSKRFLDVCMRPFFYGQFGMSIDKLSVDLANFSLKSDCQDKLKVVTDQQKNGKYLDIDWSTPFSFTLGTGLDIPLTPYMDLSVDMAYRSLGFGESANILGYDNVPSMRRINMLLFRFGVTF